MDVYKAKGIPNNLGISVCRLVTQKRNIFCSSGKYDKANRQKGNNIKSCASNMRSESRLSRYTKYAKLAFIHLRSTADAITDIYTHFVNLMRFKHCAETKRRRFTNFLVFFAALFLLLIRF